MAALLLDEAAFQRIPAAKQSAFIYEWIDNVTKNLSKCTKVEHCASPDHVTPVLCIVRCSSGRAKG
jgi:hypothetical protein